MAVKITAIRVNRTNADPRVTVTVAQGASELPETYVDFERHLEFIEGASPRGKATAISISIVPD